MSNIYIYLIFTLLIFPFVYPILRLIFFLILWIIFSIASLTINKKKTYEKPSKASQKWFNFGYWILIKGSRTKINYTGLETVPENQNFLFVSNHRSNFDNMIHSLILTKKTKLLFISKPENFKIPSGGRFMIRNCYLPLDRNSAKSGLETILKATDFIKKGYSSVGVFPEGTRNQQDKLLDFKPGCFKIAQKAKCPIIVGVTRETDSIHKNFPLKKTNVYFDIIKVLNPSDIEGKNTIQISEEIQNLIQEYLNKKYN